MSESFQTEDGRTLAYTRAGQGPLLVCHPGGPGLPAAEFGELAGLGDLFELVLLDPRGTGGSDRPRDPRAYSFDDYVADLEALRVELGAERFGLLGMSHGGMVAIAYAASHPQRLEQLLLVATLAHVGPGDEAAMERGLAAHEGQPWYADARAALDEEQHADFADDEQLRANLARQWPLYFGSFGERERAYVETIADLLPNGDALRYFNEELWPSFDLRPELARIEAPTLVVAGGADFVAGPPQARVLAEGIAGAQLVVLPGVGHFPFVEQPGAFRTAVSQFASVRA